MTDKQNQTTAQTSLNQPSNAMAVESNQPMSTTQTAAIDQSVNSTDVLTETWSKSREIPTTTNTKSDSPTTRITTCYGYRNEQMG